MRRTKFIGLSLGIFGLNYAVDRVTKLIAQAVLRGEEPVSLLFNTVVFTYAENSGAFLSLGADWNVNLKYFVLLILPIAVCTLGLFYFMFKETSAAKIITGSCIIGGGLGNLVDRLFNDFKVIDFMNFGIGGLRTGILNAADLSVTFGVIVLFIFEIKTTVQREKAAADGGKS